jgi:hypothetical protein
MAELSASPVSHVTDDSGNGDANTTGASSTEAVKIFVLALEDDCFFVGRATEAKMPAKIANHRSGTDFSNDHFDWTRLHRPLPGPPVQLHDVDPFMNVGLTQDMRVKMLMMEHGIDKVRGGTFCMAVLDASDREYLELELARASSSARNAPRR